MKQSQLFTKTQKQAPKGEESKNAILLQRAGFVAKEMAGVYSFLPLGLMVLKNIEQIIRDEMQAVGGQEILMPALTSLSSWEKTKRAGMDVLFHLEGRDNAKYVLNPTHEEVLTPLMKHFVSSYRDLPIAVFQFQNKFRNEPRAKSGLLRGREFVMKDLYSFHAGKQDLEKYYEKVKQAYFKIFQQAGIGEQTFLTFASGGSFSKYSHEFQAVCSAGEDTIYLCEKCKVAVNEEIIKDPAHNSANNVAGEAICPQCKNKSLKKEKAVETGNIFKLGTKFSECLGLTYKDEKGKDKIVEMGCYGLGLGRLIGVVAEILSDEKGLVWPKSIAPFQAHLIAIGESQKIAKEAKKVYQQLLKAGIEVLFDDRNLQAGEKFADADLIGIPLRIVVSEKTLAKDSVEIKERSSEQKVGLVKILNLDKIV